MYKKNTSIRCNNYIQLVEAEIWKRLIAYVQLNRSGGQKKVNKTACVQSIEKIDKG